MTMNGLYQLFFHMAGTQITVLYLEAITIEHYTDEQRRALPLSVVAAVVHLGQFVAVNVQLFTKAENRRKRLNCIAWVQRILIAIIPGLFVIGQAAVLILNYESSRYEVFYIWTLSSLVINFIGTFCYLI